METGILRYSAASVTVRTGFMRETMPDSIADSKISVKNYPQIARFDGRRIPLYSIEKSVPRG